MKRFIKEILLFSLPVFGFILFVWCYYLITLNKATSELERISQYECIIMGDSQMQRIKPSLFTCNTYSFASSAEHYYFSYQKIRKVLSCKDYKTRRIILGINPHVFAPVYSRRFNTEFPEGRENLLRFIYFLDLKSQDFLKAKDFLSLNFVKGVFSGPDWGGISTSFNNNPDSTIINTVFGDQYRIMSNESPYASEQMIYLSKIDSLCHANEIDLLLVSLPYHSAYYSKIDTYYIDIFEENVEVVKYAKHINYLDARVDPELMSDGTHLNSNGSDLYSKRINDFILQSY